MTCRAAGLNEHLKHKETLVSVQLFDFMRTFINMLTVKRDQKFLIWCPGKCEVN